MAGTNLSRDTWWRLYCTGFSSAASSFEAPWYIYILYAPASVDSLKIKGHSRDFLFLILRDESPVCVYK